MNLLSTYKNLDLIEISPGKYCVRKRYKLFWWWDRVTYFDLFLKGTDFTFDSLLSRATVTDDRERAEYVFNCNCLQIGKAPNQTVSVSELTQALGDVLPMAEAYWGTRLAEADKQKLASARELLRMARRGVA